MTTPRIIPEERAEWRLRYALDRTDLYYAQRVRALDALEAAEARAEKAEAMLHFILNRAVPKNRYPCKKKGGWFCPIPHRQKHPFPNVCTEHHDCLHCWLEWAAQEAAKEGAK